MVRIHQQVDLPVWPSLIQFKAMQLQRIRQLRYWRRSSFGNMHYTQPPNTLKLPTLMQSWALLLGMLEIRNVVFWPTSIWWAPSAWPPSCALHPWGFWLHMHRRLSEVHSNLSQWYLYSLPRLGRLRPFVLLSQHIISANSSPWV